MQVSLAMYSSKPGSGLAHRVVGKVLKFGAAFFNGLQCDFSSHGKISSFVVRLGGSVYAVAVKGGGHCPPPDAGSGKEGNPLGHIGNSG